MKSPASVANHQELPVFLPGRDGEIFGILTAPAGRQVGATVVMLPGGGRHGSIGRGGHFVKLCRILAASGFHTFRFDYHGVGESGGTVDRFWLDRPFVGDLKSVSDWLGERSPRRLIFIGFCFGARTALSFAPHCKNTAGLMLFSTPTRDFRMEEGSDADGESAANANEGAVVPSQLLLRGTRSKLRLFMRPETLRGLADATTRHTYYVIGKHFLISNWSRLTGDSSTGSHNIPKVSRKFRRPLAKLVQERVPVLFVYGDTDDYWPDFQRAARGELSALLTEAACVDTRVLVGGLHRATSLAANEATTRIVIGWLHDMQSRWTGGEEQASDSLPREARGSRGSSRRGRVP